MNAIRSILLLSVVVASACAREASDTATAAPSQTGSAAKAGDTPSTALPILIVHKNESCECCSLWVEHMKRAGFAAEIRNVDNMEPIKRSVGIPAGMGSCHTAQVGRYFIEGHVPAQDVLRLLAEQPDVKGLTVPRMPVGSPGMEVPSGEVQPYDVYLVANDGTTSVYVHHKGTTR